MGLLSKEDILNSDDMRYCYLAVPEWKGNVKLRTLTAQEKDDFELACLEEKKVGKKTTHAVNLRNIRAKLVAMCVCDEKGCRVFDDNDIMALGLKNGKAVDRVYERARDLNGMSEDEIESLAKNSESDLTDDSPSDSAAS
jgi:hypothetical protein